MNLIKKICLCCMVIIIGANFSIFAKEYNTNQRGGNERALSVLKQYKIFEEAMDKPQYGKGITKRDALKLACNVMGGIIYIDRNSTMESRGLRYEYEDITYDTDDSQLVVFASWQGLLQGKEIKDNKRIADLDSYVTVQEALLILDRLFITDTTLQRLKENNAWFDFAQELGLINSQTPNDRLNLYFDFNEKDDLIESYDYIYLTYRALFIPRTVRSYSGWTTRYYFYDLVEFPIGSRE